jgi:CheY-specific phosphatase CheX
MRELEGAITEITSLVCTTMLGIEAEPCAPHQRKPGERAMVGCVQITGSWSGAVLISCEPDFAVFVAKRLFGTTGETSPEEERDALGEISNMIAGNLKALLPAPSFLALPTVSDGTDSFLEVLRSRPVDKYDLLAGGHPVTVVVVTRELS